METAQQTQTGQPTPEQLLKLLDLQIEQERGKRAGKSRNRASFLVGGVLVIIAVASLALLTAQQLISDLHERAGQQPVGHGFQDER